MLAISQVHWNLHLDVQAPNGLQGHFNNEY